MDSQSTFYKKTVDILISNGVISKIGNNLNAGHEGLTIDAKDCLVVPGFTDMRCRINDLGYSYKEDIESACAAAAHGGFTDIVSMPDTEPIVDSKSGVEFFISQSKNKIVNIWPIGACTQNLNGEELAEMYDMHSSGAVAFSNADIPFKNGESLKRALLYAKGFNGLVCTHAQESSFANIGIVNESENTIHTGLKSSPSLSEIIQVQKEIAIAAYCDAPLHFSHISCKESVDLIKKAKKAGIKISCDVSLMHLIYTDEHIIDYNSIFKICPPLRTNEDRLALIQGVNDGTIDAIVSDHNPQNIELKDVEFDYAAFGASTLQCFISAYNTFLKDEIDWDVFINASSSSPRELLGLSKSSITVNNAAHFTLFNPQIEWTLTKKNNKSKSENSPFWNKKLMGKTQLLINRDKYIQFSD